MVFLTEPQASEREPRPVKEILQTLYKNLSPRTQEQEELILLKKENKTLKTQLKALQSQMLQQVNSKESELNVLKRTLNLTIQKREDSSDEEGEEKRDIVPELRDSKDLHIMNRRIPQWCNKEKSQQEALSKSLQQIGNCGSQIQQEYFEPELLFEHFQRQSQAHRPHKRSVSHHVPSMNRIQLNNNHQR